MLYRPNFCCHCGEKITRAQWTPLASRRFCDFCAVEQKQHDLIPRASALVVLLIGVAGLTAYFGSGSRPAHREAAAARNEPKRVADVLPAGPPPGSNTANAALVSRGTAANSAVANSVSPEKGQRPSPINSSTDTVYFCGELTRKGTPCTRRVKAPGRCWQHSRQAPAN